MHLHAQGCRVNLADTAEIADALAARGFELSSTPAGACVAILQGCAVTHRADRDVRKTITKWLRQHPQMKVVVSGCAASKEQSGALYDYPNVGAVVSLDDRKRLLDAVQQLAGVEREFAGAGLQDSFKALGKTRAFLKIQDGCNSRCTYCLISRLRGRELSVPPEQVREGVLRLLEAGHREIVFCGIHLGRYGRDRGCDLADLLEMVGDDFEYRGARARLSSIEPLEWSLRLVEVIESAGWICRHFHVPIQSGDDGVLRSMGRPYTAKQAADVLAVLRERFPDACLGTDLLVGFPGEDDAAFEKTYTFAVESSLDRFHVFPFSARPGTPAASMEGKVEQGVVKRRVERLLKLGDARWRRFVESAGGRRLQVLVERVANGCAEGISSEYLPVTIRGAGVSAGSLVSAEGCGVEGARVVARLLDAAGGRADRA